MKNIISILTIIAGIAVLSAASANAATTNFAAKFNIDSISPDVNAQGEAQTSAETLPAMEAEELGAAGTLLAAGRGYYYNRGCYRPRPRPRYCRPYRPVYRPNCRPVYRPYPRGCWR